MLFQIRVNDDLESYNNFGSIKSDHLDSNGITDGLNGLYHW